MYLMIAVSFGFILFGVAQQAMTSSAAIIPANHSSVVMALGWVDFAPHCGHCCGVFLAVDHKNLPESHAAPSCLVRFLPHQVYPLRYKLFFTVLQYVAYRMGFWKSVRCKWAIGTAD